MKNKVVTIKIPAQITCFSIVRCVAEEITEMICLEKKEIAKIILALEESIVRAIEYSNQESFIEVTFEVMPTGLKMIVHDWGKPCDVELLPEYQKGDTVKLDGLGIFLLRELMDEVSFVNQGRDGNEVSLVKYFGQRIMEGSGAIYEENKGEKTARKTGEIEEIRMMEPQEAIAVATCIYEAYGNSYPNEKMYYPEHIREMNKNGTIISWVVALTTGEIVGHGAMEKCALDENMYEFGAAAVYPEYRGKGILNKLSDELLGKSKELQKYGVYTASVCSHPYSQKVSHKMGLVDCYILLAMLPNMRFTSLRPEGASRESIIHSFAYLQEVTEADWYLPLNHKGMIEEIGRQLGIDIQEEPYEEDSRVAPEINVEVKVNPYGSAEIIVNSYSEETKKEIQRQLKILCLQRVEAVYCYLLLHRPVAQQLCATVEQMGFFFAGVLPGSYGKGWLILQYLNNRVMDYNTFQLNSEFGKELLSYIERCNEGVNL